MGPPLALGIGKTMIRFYKFAAIGGSLLVLGCLTATATEGGWKADVSKASIPQRPISGMNHGQPFKVGLVRVQLGVDKPATKESTHPFRSVTLSLQEGKEFMPDREFMIFLALKPGEKLDGKVFSLAPTKFGQQAPSIHYPDGASIPHVQGIHMAYKIKGQSLPTHDMPFDGYSLHVFFGKTRANNIPCQIYLAMPDKEKSWIAGTCIAPVITLVSEKTKH
jgi:hypothetical protein